MASSIATQLSQIAASSTNSLNLKAQKASHSKSLIFEPRVAASQSFDSLYTLCHEGFQELCLLDGRFTDFQRSIFSEQSKDQDRTQMTIQEISELDKRLEAFLGLVGGRLRLNPAVKAVEWLVRRFRIHEQNTVFVLTTFLPYHTLPIFTTLLSILPPKIPVQYSFLRPYIRSLTQPPRHTVVLASINDAGFSSLLNDYVLKISNERQSYPALVSFWAGIMTETVSAILDKSRSGRPGVQMEKEQQLIIRLVPFLNEGLALKKVPELRIGCYMLLSVMASKGGLDDKLISAMMEALVLGWTSDTHMPGLVCLSILAQRRGAKQLTRRVTKELVKVTGLSDMLLEVSCQRRIDKLASGLCLALVDRLSKKPDAKILPLVEHIVIHGFLLDSQSVVIIKALLLVAYTLDDIATGQQSVRNDLAITLTTMAQATGRVGTIFQSAMEDSSMDMDELEMKLHTTIRPMKLPSVTSPSLAIEDSESNSGQEPLQFCDLLAKLPTRNLNEVSFLSHGRSYVYDQLCEVFLNSMNNDENLAKFANAPILQREAAAEQPFYFSFCIRAFCGLSPVLVRAAAIRMIGQRLHEIKTSVVDFQAIIPYVIVALMDPALKVRQSAANLASELERQYPIDEDLKKKKFQSITWAATDVYDSDSTQAISWLSSDQAARVLRDMIIPALEECVLDENHISVVVERILNSSNKPPDTPKKLEVARWSQVLRAAVLSFLASHTVSTPLYKAKFRLLASLNQVRGVASLNRTKTLLPILQNWAALSSAESQRICNEEQIDIGDFDDAAVRTVVGTDADGLNFLASVIKAPVSSDRPQLVSAALRRLREMWPSLKAETRASTAQMLMGVALWPVTELGPSAETQGEAMDLLRTVDLSTDILLSFLNQLPTATKLDDAPPVAKRRRTSHGEAARANLKDPKQLTEAIRKTTFVLQLIESSRPQDHSQLLKGLFSAFAELQHFKTQVGSELGYLQCLALDSSLAIMKNYKSDRALKLDPSAVRADLLVDCVQKTSSPQVQNAALLLIASLADIAPELVLHSVMPIFTFMGTSILRQNDEYSAHVIKQTIAEVIPPLIASLRKAKNNPVTGAAEVLLSFVAAYEHVPSHRRQGLFSSLVRTLGADEFLFALLAMLVNKYGATESIKVFSADLCGTFSVHVQLQTAARYLELVSDVLAPKPTISVLLLQSSDLEAANSRQIAVVQLALLTYLLSQQSLVHQTSKQLQRDDMNASRIREMYSSILEKTLHMVGENKSDKPLQEACGNVLESILGLLSTSEFVKSVEKLLETPDKELRRKILKCLLLRIEGESQSNSISRLAMLNFLPHLTATIRESEDFFCKHIAVACVDKIAEKYGKKDLEVVAAAAETIAGNNCLGQSEQRLEVISLLCLASLVEILREAIVPVLPTAIPKALEYMRKSVELDNSNTELHNAGYAFISALLEHLPYMISGPFLDQLLSTSNDSAKAGIDEGTKEARTQCLELGAKRVEAKFMLVALRENWSHAIGAGTTAVEEYLNILSIIIDSHPKSTVTKHSPVLSAIFMDAFDLQRQWSLKSTQKITRTETTAIEDLVNGVAIKMIYKLNDSTFRPFFAGLVEWAANSLPKQDKRGRNLRLQSLYSFTTVLFASLKSIVTNYATYILDISVETLGSTDVKDDESKELWERVLKSLVECFKHDQDDFWQSPSHFNVIAPALTSQFLKASNLPLDEELFPAIVELAAAADSADHHKEMNGTILKLMRSESTSVRLAAVKCEQALTDRLGEEWLSMLPEMLPFISELQEDDDEEVEREAHRWIVKIETVLGESLDSMLQ